MRRTAVTAVLIAAALAATAGCGDGEDESGSAGAGGAAAAADPATDKLAQVLARGTLLLSTDLRYPPQSYEAENAKRAEPTKCAPNQLTYKEVRGFDADTGKLVARALGVEPCFVTPSWTEITAGKWTDRWDIAYGSGAITAERMKRLWMTATYRAEPQRFFVHKDSPYRTPSDLDGKRVGACASCSAEAYLKDDLELPGTPVEQKVKSPRLVTFDVDGPGLEALGDRKLDGFVCNENVGKQAIQDGLPLRALEEPAFEEYLTGFVDKSTSFEVGPFIARVNKEIKKLHESGALKELSVNYFGADYAAEAAAFDLAKIGQRAPA